MTQAGGTYTKLDKRADKQFCVDFPSLPSDLSAKSLASYDTPDMERGGDS